MTIVAHWGIELEELGGSVSNENEPSVYDTHRVRVVPSLLVRCNTNRVETILEKSSQINIDDSRIAHHLYGTTASHLIERDDIA